MRFGCFSMEKQGTSQGPVKFLQSGMPNRWCSRLKKNALSVFQEMKGEVSPCLWNGIARAMWRDRRDANSKLSPVLFRRLCNILVATYSSGCRLELLCYLTNSCRFPGDAEAFFLLFDHCCKVRLIFRAEDFRYGPRVFWGR